MRSKLFIPEIIINQKSLSKKEIKTLGFKEQTLKEFMSKNKTNVHFSSEKADWETPDVFFQAMEKLFGKFDFDAAANYENKKVLTYFGPDGPSMDGLTSSWMPNKLAWLNPPYGRYITGKWVQKAADEVRNGVKTVCLLPARTDTKWFEICFKEASEIYFIKGRLKFKGAKDGAPFPSMIVVFEQHGHVIPFIRLMNKKGEIL